MVAATGRLGRLTSINASTLSRMETRLARLDFVARHRSATDKREVAVALTAKGRKSLRQLVPIAQRYETRAAVDIACLS